MSYFVYSHSESVFLSGDLDLCYNCKVDYPLSKKIGHVKLMAQATTERLRKRHLKSDFALRQICSRLFHLVQYVKFWQIFLALNSKRLYVSKHSMIMSLYH